jgi:hypothetical protein
MPRARHVWRLRDEGLRDLLLEHRWGLRGGYASKSIRGTEYMLIPARSGRHAGRHAIWARSDFWRALPTAASRPGARLDGSLSESDGDTPS